MKIVFCGGGTAGHVTPNLALIDELTTHEIHYIGSNGMEKELTKNYLEKNYIFQYHEITANKLKRKLCLSNLRLPFDLLKSVRQSKKHLRKIQPNVVFSKGGYVGLPVVIAARQLKIPTIIHESDITMGLSNKICAMFTNKILCTFDCHKKGKVVGGILRKQIFEGNRQKGLETIQFDGKKPILLVMGGSLGANALNNAIMQNKSLSNIFDVFVITGKGKKIDCDFVHQCEYVENIADVFSCCDICLTRAGSNSLLELTLANIPFVTVPLTKCSRGEQIKNAKWFTDKGCGIMLEENKLNRLSETIITTYNQRNAIIAKQKAQKHMYGTPFVINEILSYNKKQG